MKKLLILALMIAPMTSFAASSVRVLGNNTGTASVAAKPAAKVVPAKTTATKSTGSNAATSRIGTLRAKTTTKPTNTITAGSSTSSSTSTSGSRFPVITPAHSYNTVATPQAGGTVVVSSEYPDDPRVDMIRKYTSGDALRQYWLGQVGDAEVERREHEGYVFMWIEE